MNGFIVSMTGDFQGCGHQLLPGRMEKSRPWPEEGVQGCDVGDLQQMT
jgi:hypothetical protein